MVLVKCNDFEPPTDEFLDGLQSEWPDGQVCQVAELGVQIEHIREAYLALRAKPVLTLDRRLLVVEQATLWRRSSIDARGCGGPPPPS